MTRSPLLCCTSIIRSSSLVQALSSLSMICARAWPTGATRQRNPFPPFFARVLTHHITASFDTSHNNVPFREESCRSSCIYSGPLHSHSRDAVSQHLSESTRAGAESIQLIYSGRALQALSDLARQFRCHPIFWWEFVFAESHRKFWKLQSHAQKDVLVLMLPTQKRVASKVFTETRNCLSLPTKMSFFEKVPTNERNRLVATHIWNWAFINPLSDGKIWFFVQVKRVFCRKSLLLNISLFASIQKVHKPKSQSPVKPDNRKLHIKFARKNNFLRWLSKFSAVTLEVL